MPQIKSVLGHASVQTAARQRICYRHRAGKTSHVIVKGETCLVIHGPDGSDRNYCRDSAADILGKAQDDLDALKSGLGLEGPRAPETLPLRENAHRPPPTTGALNHPPARSDGPRFDQRVS